MKGSPIEENVWHIWRMTQRIKDDLENITSTKSEQIIMPIKYIIKKYKGIDWMRLLNGILVKSNVTIKETDFVIVNDHAYFSRLYNNVINFHSKR